MLKHVLCATVLTFVTSSAFAETAPATPEKMTAAQCETLWKQALGTDTGDLAMAKAQPYASDFKKVDMNADGKLQAKEWMDGCNSGLIKSAAVTAPAGATPAANAPAATPPAAPGGKTSDRSPAGATERTPGASNTGAAGTDAGQTNSGTSDRTPGK